MRAKHRQNIKLKRYIKKENIAKKIETGAEVDLS